MPYRVIITRLGLRLETCKFPFNDKKQSVTKKDKEKAEGRAKNKQTKQSQ